MEERIEKIYQSFNETKYALTYLIAARSCTTFSNLIKELPPSGLQKLKQKFKEETANFLLCETLKSTIEQSTILKQNLNNLLSAIKNIQDPPPEIQSPPKIEVIQPPKIQPRKEKKFIRPIIFPDGMCSSCKDSFIGQIKGVSASFSPLCPQCNLTEKFKCTSPECPCKGEGKIYSVTYTSPYYGVHIHFKEGFYLYTPVQRFAVVGEYVARREKKFNKKFYKKLQF